jgi:hypothetical protein
MHARSDSHSYLEIQLQIRNTVYKSHEMILQFRSQSWVFRKEVTTTTTESYPPNAR